MSNCRTILEQRRLPIAWCKIKNKTSKKYNGGLCFYSNPQFEICNLHWLQSFLAARNSYLSTVIRSCSISSLSFVKIILPAAV
jgi:hypothetical protein